MADDDETKTKKQSHEYGNSRYGRAKRSLEDAHRKLARLKDVAVKGKEAQAQIKEARAELDLAEAQFAAQSHEVVVRSVPALAEELRQVTAVLMLNYTVEGQTRVHQILSAARMAGLSGQSYEMFRMTVERIKSGRDGLDWDVFNSWIKQPAEAA